METKEEIEQKVSLYQLTFPAEQPELTSLIQFLQQTLPQHLFSRTNFNGHITASAFVIDQLHQALLLIQHKKLERWLQPGGHVDSTDESLMASAIRETVEETGLKPESLHSLPSFKNGTIFDIDSHTIPANINKNEPEHTHHDLRFLFVCSDSNSLLANVEEANDITWCPLNSLDNDHTFGRVSEKIKHVLSQPLLNVIDDKLV